MVNYIIFYFGVVCFFFLNIFVVFFLCFFCGINYILYCIIIIYVFVLDVLNYKFLRLGFIFYLVLCC